MLPVEELLRIRSLRLRAKIAVEGFLVGAHRSPYHGFSVEFAEHRPYERGDEPKFVDWRVFARTERLYTKKFAQETNLPAHVILDASASMAFGNKWEYARTLAAALIWLLGLARDAVGLVIFGERVSFYAPPRSRKPHLDALMGTIQRTEPQGETRVASSFLLAAGRIRRRGLSVVISDLMAPKDEVIRGVRGLAARGEVILFQVLTPDELRGPSIPGVYMDMETGERRPFDPGAMGEAYLRSLRAWLDGLRGELQGRRVEHLVMATDEPLSGALAAFLARRARMK